MYKDLFKNPLFLRRAAWLTAVMNAAITVKFVVRRWNVDGISRGEAMALAFLPGVLLVFWMAAARLRPPAWQKGDETIWRESGMELKRIALVTSLAAVQMLFLRLWP